MTGCGKPCNCPSYRDHCLSISVSATATPSRAGHKEVADAADMEKRMNKDIPAYERLKASGVQPRHVHGAHRVEQAATHDSEVNDGKLYGSKRIRAIDEAKTIQKELAS